MKILIFNWRDPKNPKAGGAELVTLEYAKSWVRNGYKVFWFTSAFNNAKKREILEGVEIIRFGNSLSVFWGAPFYYFFSNEKFDLVIDEFHGIPFFTPLYVRQKKIAFIHEVAGEIWKYMYPFPFSYVGRIIESFALRIYKNVYFITVSQSTANELKKIGIKKISVLTNGIHIPLLSNTIKKEKLTTYICVNRLVKMKGIEDILLAFRILQMEDKNAKLWIVGDGEKRYISKLKQLVKGNNLQKKVIFFGKVNEQEKMELMKRAHLLLHASIKEGWGLVVIEAASQGTPAIVYNVGGLRDSVIQGKTGIILQENTPEEMAIKAAFLMRSTSLYQRMQRSCILYARELTWEKATRKSLQLIHTLIK